MQQVPDQQGYGSAQSLRFKQDQPGQPQPHELGAALWVDNFVGVMLESEVDAARVGGVVERMEVRVEEGACDAVDDGGAVREEVVRFGDDDERETDADEIDDELERLLE